MSQVRVKCVILTPWGKHENKLKQQSQLLGLCLRSGNLTQFSLLLEVIPLLKMQSPQCKNSSRPFFRAENLPKFNPLGAPCKRLRAVSEQITRNDRKSRSFVFLCFETKRKRRCMTFADCRLQTADRRLQTADCMRQQDCKLNETQNIVIKVASSSTSPCSEKYM